MKHAQLSLVLLGISGITEPKFAAPDNLYHKAGYQVILLTVFSVQLRVSGDNVRLLLYRLYLF